MCMAGGVGGKGQVQSNICIYGTGPCIYATGCWPGGMERSWRGHGIVCSGYAIACSGNIGTEDSDCGSGEGLVNNG